MLQFFVGVLFGIAIVLFIAYVLILDPFTPASDQPQPFIDQFRPVQIPEELRNFLKSGDDGQGISKWESCNSISLLLHMLFQEHKDTRLLRRWVHKKIQMEMNDITTRSTAGRFIQEIRIRDLSLGTKFMTVNSIRVEKIEMAEDQNIFEKIIFVLDIDYSGGFEASIDVATIIAKRASLSVKITKLTGMIRVILSRQPYHHWTFSFVTNPVFETDITSMIQGHQLKRIIPVIKEAFRRSLQRKHVWPNYKIRYRPFFPNPIFQASPPINSFSHIKMEGGIEVTVLQCSRLKNSLIDDKNKNYEVYCTVVVDHRPLVQNEEQGHCVSVLLTFSRYDLNTPIGIVFDKNVSAPSSNQNRPVRVQSVEDNSLADKAAFKTGDVLVAINSVPIRSERQATRFLQQTIGDLMVLVERSLDDIDDDELNDGEVIVSTVRDVDGFEVLGEVQPKRKEKTSEETRESSTEAPIETARRRHSLSNFESSVMDTQTESVNSSVFSLDASRFEKPSSILVQRAESARVPQVLVSQPSCDLRRTQSESRLDGKLIDAILASDDFSTENNIEDEIRNIFVGESNRIPTKIDAEPEFLVVEKRDDKDRTLTQADAAKGLTLLASQDGTGSVASLNSVNSNRTDTEGETVEDEESSSLNRKRPTSTRKTKIQATWAAGKKKMMDFMPQKKKISDSSNFDFNGESIEIGADAGILFDNERESMPRNGKRSPTDDKKDKKKGKKLSESPKGRPKTKGDSPSNGGPFSKMRTTKSVQFQKDVMWGQSLHFELEPHLKNQTKYLNVTVYAKEVVVTPSPNASFQNLPSTPESLNSTDSAPSVSSPISTTKSASNLTPNQLEPSSKPILLGSVSLFIPQLIDDCKLTLSNCHREVFQLKQPNTSQPIVKEDSITAEFARHAGFDPRLCFGDITLGFRYFPNGLPTGTALNSGDDSDEEMIKVTGTNQEATPIGRPFSPPVFSPANHDWKLWYAKTAPTCAMCRGKIWMRSASQCSRCLVICHNKCVQKANQGGIACTPQQAGGVHDNQFEELVGNETSSEHLITRESNENEVNTNFLQTPGTPGSMNETPETSKRARLRKVTEKFSNWRKGSGKRKEDEVKGNEGDRMSQQSFISSGSTATSYSTDASANQESERDSPMACIQDVLSDVLPTLDGSPFINGLFYQPGNAYNEQTIKNAKELGRTIFSDLPSEQRIEKINSQIDRIQTAIRETKDDRLTVMKNGGESSSRFQGLDERLQALAVLMLHYCSALQDCQSGRSTPAPPVVQEEERVKQSEEDAESFSESFADEERTLMDEIPRPNALEKSDNVPITPS